MRKFLLLSIAATFAFTANSQDFSNKGKDFWVGYGYHQQMTGANGGPQQMVLYFATDQVTNITINIPALGYTQTLTSGAGNNVLTSAVMPKTGPQDCRLTTDGLSNKGIHITSDKPIVAYAHIYNSSVSGACILFPTNTLGKEYYSVNFKNWSNSTNANCWFYVVAADTGTTTLEITPTGNTTGGWLAGTSHTVTLTQGQIYNVMGALVSSPMNCNPVCTGVDLTGSKIISKSSGGSGCKRIGVFSGSGRISITCNNNSSSSDNYMVQSFPKTAWGKKYLTAPAAGNQAFNFYRVCVTDPTTVVKINGVVTALPLQGGFYYEIAQTDQPQMIEADKPIMVAQYFTSQGSCGNGSPGDPEVIYLSSVEQNISKVIFNSNILVNPNPPIINIHCFNVVIPNTGTAITSFRLDGAQLPAGSFIVHPQDPNYSYARINTLALGQHVIQSDSGFNAIAYGFASTESYGYNAGTNIKDLYQQIGVTTQFGIETTPSVCTNSPFKFKVSLPYEPDSMHWDFHNAATMLPNNTNVSVIVGTGAYDSTTIVNTKTIYWYSLPTQYHFTAIGSYPITITTYSPDIEGCGAVHDIDFDLVVSDPPVASFTATGSGCIAEPVQFTETTPQFPKATYHFWWNFGDPGSGGANNTSALRNPIHTFSAPGTYNVRFADITTPGCLSDTITNQVVVTPLPSATISGSTVVCINAAMPTITFTGTGGKPEYVFSYNIDNGSGPGPTLTANSVAGVATVSVPTTIAGTFVYTLLSVKNLGSTLCTQNIAGQQATVTVNANATISLTSAPATDNQVVCINTPITNITYAIAGSGTGASITAGAFPTGVTGSFAAGVFTITGTPTVSGTFNYTITTSGPCGNSSLNGTITVNANSTISLSSAAGTDGQTVCINNAITDITYIISGGGTSASITAGALPAGVTGSFAGGVFTIAGTPTVSGTFNYTVTSGGPCINPSLSGTITVNANSTIILSSAAGTDGQTVCINHPITAITYAIGGSGTGASITAGALPAGVTGVFAGSVFTITGTPTVSGTFNYTITTSGPCINNSLTGTITVDANSTITLSSAAGTDNQSVCRNSPIVDITYAIAAGGTGAAITAGALPAGVTGSFAGGVFTITGTPTVSGVFNYTITTSGPCINPSLSGTITVYALPTPNFTFNAPSCETRTITFTDASVANVGSVIGWAWTFGDPGSGAANNSALQNPTHSFAAAGVYNVMLSVTTNNGCISNPPANIPVTINARPKAGFIIPEVCLSDTYAQFNDTSKVAGGAIVAWNWNFGDPGSGVLNTSILQNPQHSYTAVGNYNVRLIATSNNGCKDTITQLLTINGSFPVANFTVNNPATLCANDSVAIVNTSTVFPGNITKVEIYWDNIGQPAVFQLDDFPFSGKVYKHLYPNFQAPLTKPFTIRFRAYSGGVCVNDKISVITVNAAPKVLFNNMPNSCLLTAPFQITQASEIGGVPGNGVYSGTGVTATGIFSPAIAGIGTFRIKYTYTSTAAGCVDTMSNTITVLDTAHATFTYVSPICEQTGASFTEASTVPAGIVLSNSIWDFGDGTPLENHLPGTTFTHVFASPGVFVVKMHNVSSSGCNSTVYTQSVTVDPNHSITLTSGNNIQTQCINTLIAPITYTLGGGATNATVVNLPAGVNYAVVGTTLTISGTPSTTAGSPFNYTIQTTGNTCVVANASGTITVDPDHTIALSSPAVSDAQSVCVNSAIDPITYTLGGGATGAVITGLPAGVTYSVTGNTLTIIGTPSVTLGGPTFNYSILTSGNSCIKATALGKIIVNPYPVPDFTTDKLFYCIPNASVKFTNGTTIEDGSPMTYLWDFGDMLSGGNTQTSINGSHWYTGTGPFNVTLTATSTALLSNGTIGCSTVKVIPLNSVHPQPKAGFNPSKPRVCIADDVTFIDNSLGMDGTVKFWNWDFGDGTKSVANPAPHLYLSTDTFKVSLYITNSIGCNSDTLIKPFAVYPYPVVDAGPDRFILEGGSIVLQPVVTGNDLQFLWTPNIYIPDNKLEKPTVSKPLDDVTYKLTVTGRGGCAISDVVFVKLLRFPKIPNTFTPNNDGINDTWRIDYLNTYPNNRVQVFTRTGQLVFESHGYNSPWDGTMKGKPLPFDTYYYIIEPGNGRDPITGYVTIIK